MVLLATGITPAADDVAGLHREADRGVRVDAGMRCAPGVYAAGDVARFPLPDQEAARIEHWRVAQQQGRIAAYHTLGAGRRYDDVPFLWTYHYEQRVDYLGHASCWNRIEIDGHPNAQDFIAYFLRDEQVAAVLACQRERLTAALRVALRAPLSWPAAQRLTAAMC